MTLGEIYIYIYIKRWWFLALIMKSANWVQIIADGVWIQFHYRIVSWDIWVLCLLGSNQFTSLNLNPLSTRYGPFLSISHIAWEWLESYIRQTLDKIPSVCVCVCVCVRACVCVFAIKFLQLLVLCQWDHGNDFYLRINKRKRKLVL